MDITSVIKKQNVTLYFTEDVRRLYVVSLTSVCDRTTECVSAYSPGPSAVKVSHWFPNTTPGVSENVQEHFYGDR